MLTANLQKWGNSQGIRIPKTILDELQWECGDELMIQTKSGRTIIEPVKKNLTIQELFRDYNGKYEAQEVDWGEKVGKEIW
ncbi:MAG: AbrB/MazE/SpoVT family DNA-binding domain-containing protein [Acidaminococcaceae bacterium]|nr:AbrB/MazE/SpoVT family DNA-binding domain-containing protein [Acidaminococcaceae bacterium]